jgi:hypothetical protein
MKKSGQVLVRTMSSQSDELPKGSRGMSGVLNLGGEWAVSTYPEQDYNPPREY